MPDFDKGLNTVLRNNDPVVPQLDNPRVASQGIMRTADLSGKPASTTDEFFGSGPMINSMPGSISVKDINKNTRYGMYDPSIIDIEDQKAYAQSGMEQSISGILKGVNLAATTVAGGFGMLYGAAKMPFSGKLSDLWNNEITKGLDKWNNKVDQELLPNFYTNVEHNAKWYSTDNWFTPNFLFDKLVKNSGFAVGAMLSGNIANAGLLRLGAGLGELTAGEMALGSTLSESKQAMGLYGKFIKNISKAFSAGKNAEVAALLEDGISSIADLGTKTARLGEIAQETNTFFKINDVGRRSIIAAYSSAGESMFEALQTGNELRDNLINEYKSTHEGESPKGEALQKIEDTVANAGRMSFFGNMMLLGATEYFQLPYLTGSSYKASKQAANSLMGKIAETVEKDGLQTIVKPTTKFGRLYDKATSIGKYIFDPKESLQEGLQFALQVGTLDYYNKAYKSNGAESLINSMMVGLGQSVNTKEGMESMLLGGLTGGPMQARQNFLEDRSTESNTQAFLNSINNAPTFKGAFVDKMKSMNRSIALQKQQQDAILKNDKLEAKDLEADLMHNYLAERIKYGRFDMVKDDITELKRTGMTPGGLHALKQEGIANINDTSETFLKRINTFEQVADATNELYKALDLRYSGVLDKEGKRVYNPEVIDTMVYAASKISDYDLRIPQLNLELTKYGISVSEVLNTLLGGSEDGKQLNKEAIAEITALEQTISKLDQPIAVKNELQATLNDLIELASRRKLYMSEYDDMITKPKKWNNIVKPITVTDTSTKAQLPPPPAAPVPETKNKPSYTNKDGVSENIEVGREYINEGINSSDPLHKVTVVSVNADGSVTLKDTDGTEANYLPEELTGFSKVRNGKDAVIEHANEIKSIQEQLEDKTEFSTGFEVDQYLDNKETALPSADKVFFRTTTASSLNYPGGLPVNVARYNEFVSKVDSLPNRSKIRFVYVSYNQEEAFGLKGLSKWSYAQEDSPTAEWVDSITEVENGLVMSVFVEDTNGKLYLIDKDGKHIKNQNGTDAVLGDPNNNFNIKETIFSTTPRVSTKTRSNEKPEVVEHYRNLWKEHRENVLKFKYTPGDPIDSYEFGLSKGFTVKTPGVLQRNPISKVFTNLKQSAISNTQGLVEVSTLGYITHKDGTTYKFAVGRPVLKHGDKLEYLQNDKFGKSQAEAIVEVLKKLHDVFVDTSLTKDKKIQQTAKYTNFLKGVLYWSSKRVTSNSFYINYNTGNINIAGNEYDFSNIENNKVAIIADLQNVFQNVNNEMLTKYFNDPFYEQYVEAGELKERKWKNYQTYLLSDVLPDNKTNRGSKVPLTVNATIPTEAVPYVYEQRYAFPTNFKLAVPQAPQVQPTAVENVKEISISGIVFKVTLDENNKVDLLDTEENEKALATLIQSNATLSQMSEGEALVNIVAAIQQKATQAAAKPATPVGYVIDGVTKNVYEFRGLKFMFTHDGVQATLDLNDTFLQGPLLDAVNDLMDANPEKYKSVDPMDLVRAFIAGATQKINEDVNKQIQANKPNAPKFITSWDNNENNIVGKTFRFFVGEDESGQPYDQSIRINKVALLENGNYKLDATNLVNGNTYDMVVLPTGAVQQYTRSGKSYRGVTTDEVVFGAGDYVRYVAPSENTTKPELIDLEEVLISYNLNNEFGFIAPLLKANNIKVSFDAAHNQGKLPEVASIDSTVVDGKYEVILTINKSAFDRKSKKEQSYVLAHEFVHALVKVRLNEKGDIKGESVYKGLTNIYDSVKDYYHNAVSGADKTAKSVIDKNFTKKEIDNLRQQLDYIGGSIEEMATLGLTDPIMIKFLKLMPGTTPEYTKKNLFTQLVDLISKFIGLPTSKFNELLTFMSTQLEDITAKPNSKISLNNPADIFSQDPVQKTSRRKPKTEGFPVFSEFSSEEKYYIVQDFTAKFYISLFRDNKSLFNVDVNSADDIFKTIIESYKSLGAQFTDSQYLEIIDATKRQLKGLYISFDEDELNTINSDSATDRLYAPEAFSVDLKKSTPYAVKILMSSLPRTTGVMPEDLTRLPERKLNETYGSIELIPESEVYTTLVNKLVNIKNVNDFIEKLGEVALANPDYVMLFKRLGGTFVRNEDGAISSVIDFDSLDDHDFRLFIGAMQTFTKSKPDMFVQYLTGGSTYRGSADLINGSKQIERRWINKIILKSKDEDSIIKYNRQLKQYVAINKEFDISSPEKQIEFLKELGVDFPISTYNKLKEKDKFNFSKSVTKIYKDITDAEVKGIVTLKRGKFKTLGNGISRLAEMYVSVEMPNHNNNIYNAEGKRINSLTESNYASLFEYQFNSLNNLAEIEEVMPSLLDDFTSSSEILKRGGYFFDEDGNKMLDEYGKPRQLKIEVISGQIDTDNDTGKSIPSVTPAERYITEINQNIKGSYYILVPADASTEWMINLGDRISIKQFQEGRGADEAIEIMMNHLDADIKLATDSENRSKLKNVGQKGTDLRFFKDILPEDIHESFKTLIEDLLKKEITQAEFDTKIAKLKENPKIDEAIRKYFNESSYSLRDRLIDLNLLKVESFEEGGSPVYTIKGLDAGFLEDIKSSNGINEVMLNNVTDYLSTNFILNNIELHKLIFGDPYQFAIKTKGESIVIEELKRIKLFISPRKYSIDFPELNTFLNESNTIYTETDDIELDENDFGYHENKSYINTTVIKDVEIIGGLYKGVNTNEADAFSIVAPGFYKEVKIKNNQWSDEANDFHNWEMANARKKLAAKGVYKGYKDKPALKKYDEELTSRPRPNFTIDVMKPIVSGSKFGKLAIDLVGHKMSQMPIYYSAVEGTALEDLFIKMFNEKRDYIVMESGSKVGSPENLHELYKDGKINDEPFSNKVVVPFSAYGIQVETGYKDKKGQTLGSQPTKIATMDLFSGGEAIGDTPERKEEIKNLVERHDNALKRLYKESADTLLEDLGITFDEDGNAEIVDYEKVAKLLKDNLINEDSSDNTIDSLALNPETKQFENPIESSTSYIRIVKLLYSLVHKRILSPKVNGMSAVQVPVTGWEDLSRGRRVVEIDGKIRLTDDTLKFYEDGVDENGKSLRYCEVMVTLPKQARALFSNKKQFPNDDAIVEYLNNMAPDALMGIGFRIPTQALSSIERFKIKKILPDFMGTTVVVPSEITTKAGSDFDIDKLNMYIKSLYKDVDGQIKVAKLLDSEEDTKEHFGNVFDKLSDVEIKRLMESLDDEDYEGQDRLIQKQENLETERERYINKMYRAAIENEYFSSIDALLDLPENFKRLTLPNTAKDLETIASDIDKLRGVSDVYKNRILNREYLSDARHGFIISKAWVGIVATGITGHSNAQKAGLFVDHLFTSSLPQNRTEDDKIDLSQRLVKKTKSGEEDVYISDNLSQTANAVVDAGTNPFIFKILYSEQIVSAFIYLIRSGTNLRTASYFLNQPIIRDLVSKLDAEGKYISSEIVKENSNIINDVRDKYATVDEADDFSINVNNFESNIKNYDKLSDEEKKEQRNILLEFFNTVKAANGLFTVTEATNYDTTKISSADEWRRKQMATISQYKFKEDSFRISSAKKLLDSTHLRTLVNELTRVYRSFGTIIRFNTPEYRAVMNKVIDTYATNQFIGKEKFNRIANRLTASLLDYIIQTNKNYDVASLVYGNNSVIDRFIKASEKYPNMKILQDLEVIPGRTVVAPRTISLKVYPESAADINRYTEGFRELRDNPETNDLYKDLVKLAIVQGTFKTSSSYREVVPYEDITAEIEQSINAPGVVERLSDFVENARFQRTNYNDPVVTPRINPKMNVDDMIFGTNKYGEPVDFYNVKDAIFISQEVADSKRQLIGLHPKSKGGSYDFVTIPRAIPVEGGDMVDFESGYVIQGTDYYAQMQKDESEYNLIYGYKKVKHENGTPVKVKLSKDSQEVYLYKLVNLYGDGRHLPEYTNTLTPSKLKNGTLKVNKEYSDTSIINWLAKQNKIIGYSPAIDVNVEVNSIEELAQLNKGREVKITYAKYNKPFSAIGTGEIEEVLGETTSVNSTTGEKILLAPAIFNLQFKTNTGKLVTADVSEIEGLVGKLINVKPTTPVTSQTSSVSKLEGNMTFSYGADKRPDVKANTTFDAILNGERTATTRYESDGNIGYWKNAKVGDVITWKSKDGRTVDVEVTKALHPLKGSGKNREQWSKLEGWSTEYFDKKVKGKLDEAWQIEYKLKDSNQSVSNPGQTLIKSSGFISNKLPEGYKKLEVKDAEAFVGTPFTAKEASNVQMQISNEFDRSYPSQSAEDKFGKARRSLYFSNFPYSYSGTTRSAKATPTWLSDMISKVEKSLGVEPGYFDIALINEYKTGDQKIGFHTDNEAILNANNTVNPTVVTVSFGDTRTMVLQSMITGQEMSFEMPNGSVAVMGYDSQIKYKHGIKQEENKGLRFSVTLRHHAENRAAQKTVVAETKSENSELLEQLQLANAKLEAFEFSTDGVFYNFFKSGARIKPGSFDEINDKNNRSASTNGAYVNKNGMPYDNLARAAFEASGMEVDDDYAVSALGEFLANYPENWKTPYTNIINEIKDIEDRLTPAQTIVNVDKQKITIKEDGTMVSSEGSVIKDETIKNKALIQKEMKEQKLRVSVVGQYKYFVLSNNKILLSTKSMLGKEYIADSQMTEKILAKAVIYKKTC